MTASCSLRRPAVYKRIGRLPKGRNRRFSRDRFPKAARRLMCRAGATAAVPFPAAAGFLTAYERRQPHLRKLRGARTVGGTGTPLECADLLVDVVDYTSARPTRPMNKRLVEGPDSSAIVRRSENRKHVADAMAQTHIRRSAQSVWRRLGQVFRMALVVPQRGIAKLRGSTG